MRTTAALLAVALMSTTMCFAQSPISAIPVKKLQTTVNSVGLLTSSRTIKQDVSNGLAATVDNVATDSVQKGIDAVTRLKDQGAQNLQVVTDSVKQRAPISLDAIPNGLKNLASNNPVVTIADKAKDVVSTTTETVADTTSAVVAKATEVVTDTIQPSQSSVTDVVSDVVGDVKSQAAPAVETLTDQVTAIVEPVPAVDVVPVQQSIEKVIMAAEPAVAVESADEAVTLVQEARANELPPVIIQEPSVSADAITEVAPVTETVKEVVVAKPVAPPAPAVAEPVAPVATETAAPVVEAPDPQVAPTVVEASESAAPPVLAEIVETEPQPETAAANVATPDSTPITDASVRTSAEREVPLAILNVMNYSELQQLAEAWSELSVSTRQSILILMQADQIVQSSL